MSFFSAGFQCADVTAALVSHSHCCFSVYLFHLCRPSEVTCAALLFAQSLLSVPLFQHSVLFMSVLLFELSLSLSLLV